MCLFYYAVKNVDILLRKSPVVGTASNNGWYVCTKTSLTAHQKENQQTIQERNGPEPSMRLGKPGGSKYSSSLFRCLPDDESNIQLSKSCNFIV